MIRSLGSSGRWFASMLVAGVLVLGLSGSARAQDCNNNGVDDATDIAMGTSDDCQPDGVPDECQLVDNDGNANSVPDECEAPPGQGDGILKSRYITVVPPPNIVRSIQVTVVDMPLDPAREGDVWRAGTELDINNSPNPDLRGAPLVCIFTPHSHQVWTDGPLHLFGGAIVPDATYEVRMCQADGTGCSAPLVVRTGDWGDAVAPFAAENPNQPNFTDINAIADKFKHKASAPDMVQVDLRSAGGQSVDFVANFADLNMVVHAFKGAPYPSSVSACP